MISLIVLTLGLTHFGSQGSLSLPHRHRAWALASTGGRHSAYAQGGSWREAWPQGSRHGRCRQALSVRGLPPGLGSPASGTHRASERGVSPRKRLDREGPSKWGGASCVELARGKGPSLKKGKRLGPRWDGEVDPGFRRSRGWNRQHMPPPSALSPSRGEPHICKVMKRRPTSSQPGQGQSPWRKGERAWKFPFP